MNAIIRQSTVVYLALIMLLRMMAMPISLLDYSLNRNFIAATLCENKAKTEMHCAGKCFLNRQLEKSNENQDARGQRGSAKILLIDFFEPFPDTVPGNIFISSGSTSPFLLQYIPAGVKAGIFHPPIA